VFQKEKYEVEKDPIAMMGLCKQPIIGAINGYAITAGFELSLSCDILIASTEAKFMDTHAKFGIFPSWGLSQKLSRLIGVNRARHASLSAMPIDAATAEKWGLVSQVVPPAELMRTARALAETILGNHGQVVQDYKAIINDGLKLPLGEALLLEKERAHARYKAMTPQDFENMDKFIAARSKSRQPPSKL
jgi:enoyl-CoA hydratase